MITSPTSLTFKNSPRGFIALEGVNGAGKSTLALGLAEYIRKRGFLPQVTREPGGTELGLSIRSLVLERPYPINGVCESLLFAADRAHHVSALIEPALHKGGLVISDRFCYSTIAFQGYGRGLSLEELWRLQNFAVQGIFPDVVILLDLPAEEGLRRTKGRKDEGKDAFEEEELAFHQRLRNGFLTMAKERPEPFVVIDVSTHSAEETLAAAMKVVDLIITAKQQ